MALALVQNSVEPGPARCIAPHGDALQERVISRPAPHAHEVIVSTDLKRDLIALLPRLRRFARTLTRSVPEADDLVQEACLRALTRADQWDRSQPLDRWMFRITRNLWISEIRKRTVRIGQGQVAADESHELVSVETGEASLAAAQLQARIAALPEELGAVLLTVSVEGYSYAEAAKLFDIPVGTVMSRIHRARKALARDLAAPEGVGP
ncbi:MAG: RNA polymerase sigma factor [Pseudomonadota bacterium]